MSPALHVWLRTAIEEPNWLPGMSLPLLENKIKNRECVPLLNVTQTGGKGSRLLAECSWKKCNIRLAGQDSGGRKEEGHDPSDPPVPTATSLALAQIRVRIAPIWKALSCVNWNGFPVSLANTGAFMKKSNDHF